MTTSILTLLIMAMQLLTAVQANPNLPQSFRDTAISIANTAISVAQNALAAQTQNTTLVAGIVPDIVVPLVVPLAPAEQPKKEITIDITSAFNNNIGTYYNIRAHYLENGKPVEGIVMNLKADDSGGINNNNEKTRYMWNDDNPGTFFQYIPNDRGDRILIFTANGTSTTAVVNGQLEEIWKRGH